MLEIGDFINKNGIEYGLLDIINYNDINYLYFSVQKNEKIDYRFYIDKSNNFEDGYDLELVKDEMLIMKLLEIEEERVKKEGFNVPESYDNK